MTRVSEKFDTNLLFKKEQEEEELGEPSLLEFLKDLQQFKHLVLLSLCQICSFFLDAILTSKKFKVSSKSLFTDTMGYSFMAFLATVLGALMYLRLKGRKTLAMSYFFLTFFIVFLFFEEFGWAAKYIGVLGAIFCINV